MSASCLVASSRRIPRIACLPHDREQLPRIRTIRWPPSSVVVLHRADRHGLVPGLYNLRRIGDAFVGNDLAHVDATSASALLVFDWSLGESRSSSIHGIWPGLLTTLVATALPVTRTSWLQSELDVHRVRSLFRWLHPT